MAKAAEFRYFREDDCDDSDCCPKSKSSAMAHSYANGGGGAVAAQRQPAEPPRISVAAVNEYARARGRLRSSESVRTEAVVTAGGAAAAGGERQVSVVETPPHSSISSSSSSLNDISRSSRRQREAPVGAAVSKLESRTRSLTNLVAAKVEARARSLKKARSHGNKLNSGGGTRGGRRADPAGERGNEHEDEGYRNFAFDEEDMVI